MKYEPVIGLEVHVQLNTKTKLFCACKTSFAAPPNLHTCPLCLGHPGTLPVLNEAALQKAILAGLALDCQVNTYSRFDRKSYFYPDLPKGYQISQQDYPICSNGSLVIETSTSSNETSTKTIRIRRLHLEEDAGKLMHSENPSVMESYVDLNRAGTPLVEIVCEPDLSSSKEATTYLEMLRKIMRYIEVSNCNMEEGSLRCDVNISLRPEGTDLLGDRTEIKNMNSFRAVKEAIDYEISRQVHCLSEGKKVHVQTLLWDTEQKQTRPMRGKEASHDYRYFPEPDLYPCMTKKETIKELQNTLPELPEAKQKRFIKDYHLPPDKASLLSSDKDLAHYYEEALKTFPDEPQKTCNWITTEILSILNQSLMSIRDFPVKPHDIGMLIKLISEGTLSGKIAKEIFPEMIRTQRSPQSIIKDKGLKVVSDKAHLKELATNILNRSAETVQKYRQGNKNVLGHFVGQAMKETKGQANPALISRLFREMLEAEEDA